MTAMIVLSGPELARAIVSVLPHAGDDDTLPALMCVKFELDRGDLVLTATDRYTLGQDRTAWIDVSDQVEPFLLFAKELKEWARLSAKAGSVVLLVEVRASGERWVRLDVGAHRVELRVYPESLMGGGSAFSRALHMLEDASSVWDAARDFSLIAFNPAILARFAKVKTSANGRKGKGDIEPMKIFLQDTPNKATLVKIGPTFVGLIQPMKVT